MEKEVADGRRTRGLDLGLRKEGGRREERFSLVMSLRTVLESGYEGDEVPSPLSAIVVKGRRRTRRRCILGEQCTECEVYPVNGASNLSVPESVALSIQFAPPRRRVTRFIFLGAW